MVAGGFLVRRGLNNPERGKAPLRLWCVPEADTACNALPGARTGRVIVTVGSPQSFEDRLTKMDPQASEVDAIVTDPWWIDRAKTLPITPTRTTPLGASVIVVVQRTNDKSCGGAIACVLALGTQASMPSVDQGITGPIAVASAFTDAKVAVGEVDNEAGDAVIRLVRPTLRPVAGGITPLQGLTSLKLLDAVVLSAADFRQAAPAGVVSSPLRPTSEIRVTLAAYTPDKRLTAVVDDLRTELLRAGWQTPGAPRTSPSNILLNAVYNKVVR